MDSIGVAALKQGINDLRQQIIDLEHQQILLSKRITLACQKMVILTDALDKWEQSLKAVDPNRKSINLEQQLKQT